MGCRKLDISSYFQLTEAPEEPQDCGLRLVGESHYKSDSHYKQKTSYSRFFYTVIPNYRYYSPVLGRWLSRDPIYEKGGYNLYGMVNNNPIVFVDDKGEGIILAGAGVVAAGYGIKKATESWADTVIKFYYAKKMAELAAKLRALELERAARGLSCPSSASPAVLDGSKTIGDAAKAAYSSPGLTGGGPLSVGVPSSGTEVTGEVINIVIDETNK